MTLWRTGRKRRSKGLSYAAITMNEILSLRLFFMNVLCAHPPNVVVGEYLNVAPLTSWPHPKPPGTSKWIWLRRCCFHSWWIEHTVLSVESKPQLFMTELDATGEAAEAVDMPAPSSSSSRLDIVCLTEERRNRLRIDPADENLDGVRGNRPLAGCCGDGLPAVVAVVGGLPTWAKMFVKRIQMDSTRSLSQTLLGRARPEDRPAVTLKPDRRRFYRRLAVAAAAALHSHSPSETDNISQSATNREEGCPTRLLCSATILQLPGRSPNALGLYVRRATYGCCLHGLSLSLLPRLRTPGRPEAYIYIYI